ncbi:Hint domain-containing protein, partial [Phaeobacter sp. HF9A]|uniref:Hint domain-containing protein n=1 Tax=Phaeobacter sp. HF9A TaxID=2721561 RepID=UPI00158E1748
MLDWFAKRTTSPMAEAFTTDYPMVSTGYAGFLAGTMVATATGWRPVEGLRPGDEVLTFDHGMRPVTSVERQVLVLGDTACAQDMAPIYIPRDALGNRNPLWVKPEQGILIEHDLLEDGLGDPFAVVPACALEGYRGIARA